MGRPWTVSGVGTKSRVKMHCTNGHFSFALLRVHFVRVLCKKVQYEKILLSSWRPSGTANMPRVVRSFMTWCYFSGHSHMYIYVCKFKYWVCHSSHIVHDNETRPTPC